MFIGREYEMKEMNHLHKKSGFQCAVVYGRRRVGKTRLLTEFCKDKLALFYVCEEHSDLLSLEKFSKMIIEGLNLPSYITRFGTWEHAFQALAEQSKNQRIILSIDEFPYLVQANPRLLSILQNTIDYQWHDSQLFLILCGSSISFMENEILSHKSPLFGRRTAQFKINHLDFYKAQQFVPHWSNEDKINLYALIGGMPQYLNQIDPSATLDENIKSKLLNKSSYLFGEPTWLLNQEFRVPSLYRSIIEAIASGSSRVNEISTKIGEPTSKTSNYLKSLSDIGLVTKKIPIGGNETSKKSIYIIGDPLLSFFYTFISPSLALLEQEMIDAVFETRVKPQLPTFYGKRFEEVCIAYLERKNKENKLPCLFDQFGSWWGTHSGLKKQVEFDIVGISPTIHLIAECKYRNELVDLAVLKTLIENASGLFELQKVYYVFSKSGFTEAATTFANSHGAIHLVGLDEIVRG
jgi:hypothetical protein